MAGETQAPRAKVRAEKAPASRLFAFATPYDRLCIAFGFICAIGQGMIFPLFTLVFANLLNSFNSPNLGEEVNTYALYFLIIAIVAGFASYVATALPMAAAERQMARVRNAYLKALLRQDVGFMDTSQAGGEVSSRLAEDTITWGSGIGEKLTGAARDATTFLTGIAVGFSKSWKLTLVIMSVAPFLAALVGVLAVTIRTSEKRTADAYAKAGDAATEAFSLIRSVAAYGGELAEVRRYDRHLATAEKAGRRKGWVMGAFVGAMFGMIFITYGIAMFAGARFVLDSRQDNFTCRINPTAAGCFSGGDVIGVFMSVLIGAFALGGAGPNFAAFGSAQAAAASLYKIIDRVPPVDSEADRGQKPRQVTGRIEFKNVTFAYPSRPEETILQDFNLVIEPGSMVALVGESGSGKSTLIQLLERYYDPQQGEISLDGIPLKDWNLRYLRDQLGLVSQDPVLFGVSVRENISFGGATGREVSHVDIIAAATAANAHGFITALPEGYETLVGTSVASAQLSGGQRQRICIARAIVRNPAVLLLDEATSALDTQSERIVQASIDALLEQSKHPQPSPASIHGKAAPSKLTDPAASTAGRTSIVIAHRLSTITGADRIVVMKKGRVVEDGTHAVLMAKEEGLYKHLRSLQDMGQEGQGQAQDNSGAVASASANSRAQTLHGAAAAQSGGGTSSQTAQESAPLSKPASKDVEMTVVVDNPMAAQAKAKAKGAARGKKEAGEETEELTKPKGKVDIWRIWRMQLPDWPWLVLAFLGAAVSGVVQPVFAVIYSEMITVFFVPSDEQLEAKSREYIGYFFLIAGVMFVATTFRIGAFVLTGEKLTRRLRTDTYRSLLRQPMAFFDDPKNSTGRLNTRLSAEAALVRGGTGETVGLMLQTNAAIIAAVVISFVASWRLALVMLAIFPLMIISHQAHGNAFKGYSMGASKALEEAGHIATEAMMAFRTVTAFNMQDHVLANFERTLEAPKQAGYGKARSAGLNMGFSSFMQFAAFALAFYVGAIFIRDGVLSFAELMRVFLAVTMASQAVGSAATWGPDTSKALAAAEAILSIIDSVSPIDPLTATGLDGGAAQGRLEFKHVSFAYPGRPDVKVLKDFNLTITPGQTVALVGESGSGKSTIVQLLERFYDPSQGEILLDGVPLTQLRVSWARAQMGLVQQEPALFADSIAYNIAYGLPEPGKQAPEQGVPTDAHADAVYPLAEIEPKDPALSTAAKDANAHTFIASFKNGYATHCGSRGSQLSGGQKQRVAIARAIVRNPPILLLDEATSALDTQSEAVVQAALDRLLQGDAKRTTLVIAHRLSTIRNADVIVVMSGGCVVEMGRHEELMAKVGGLYHKLATAQAETPLPAPGSVVEH